MPRLYALVLFFAMTLTSLHADIVMGVVPQQSPLKLLRVWKPIATYLSEQTSEKIIFKTEKSINRFEKVLYSGGYDFAYMNPYHYIIANKKQNYQAKVRAHKNIKGVLVVKKQESVEKLKDKKTLYIFPSPNAFAATLLTKYDLVKKYGVSVETLNKARYVNSHDSVYKGISRGIAQVGGGIERTFNNMSDKKTKESIKIIHTTQAYPSHPFAFKPSMKSEVRDKIINALLTMPEPLLKSLSIKKLKKIDHDEYKSVESLAIKLQIMPE